MAQNGVALSRAASSAAKSQRPIGTTTVTNEALPLMFEKNVGQPGASGDFTAIGKDYTLHLSAGNMSLRVAGKNGKADELGIALVGSDRKAIGFAVDKLPTVTNYFIGSDRSKWRTGITNYEKVRYTGIYKGVDVLFYGHDGEVEHDFVLAPHTDPGSILLEVSGAKSLRLNAGGDVAIETASSGKFLLKKADIYQEIDRKRVAVAGRYEIAGNQIRFKLSSYDRNRELTIDPAIIYGSYISGTANTSALAVAINSANCSSDGTDCDTYVAGNQTSADFTTTGTHNIAPSPFTGITGSTGTDIYIAKIAAATTGNAVLGKTFAWITIMGGSGSDTVTGISFNANAVVAGHAGLLAVSGMTTSTNFPISSNAYSSSLNTETSGGFAAILDVATGGTTEFYGTYVTPPSGAVSGSSTSINAVVLDNSGTGGAGHLFLAGTTSDPGYGNPAAITPTFATDCSEYSGANHPGVSTNGLVIEIDPNAASSAAAMVNDSLIHGGGDSSGTAYTTAFNGMALDNLATPGHAYVVGSSNIDFPTDPHTSVAISSAGITNTAAIVGDVVLTTKTPCAAASSPAPSLAHGRIIHDYSFNTNTGSNDLGTSIAYLGSTPELYVAGQTNSGTLFSGNSADTVTATIAYSGGATQDGFVAELNPTFPTNTTDQNPDAQKLAYLGGSAGDDEVLSVSVDSSGDVFAGGQTKSTSGAAPTGFPAVSAGNLDTIIRGLGKTQTGFVAEIKPDFSAFNFSTLIGGTGPGNDQVNGVSAIPVLTNVSPAFTNNGVAVAGTFAGTGTGNPATTAAAYEPGTTATPSAYIGTLLFSATAAGITSNFSAQTPAAVTFGEQLSSTNLNAVVFTITNPTINDSVLQIPTPITGLSNVAIETGAGGSAVNSANCEQGVGGISCIVPAGASGKIVIDGTVTANSGTISIAATLSDGANTSVSQTATLNASPAHPTIIVDPDPQFPYNASPQITHARAIAVDGINQVNGTFTFTYDGVSYGTGPSAGTSGPTHVDVNSSKQVIAYSVVATFTSNDPNYGGATGNGSFTIVPVNAIVKIFQGSNDVTGQQATFPYDTTAHVLTSTVTGVTGETATLTAAITYDNNSTAPTHVKVDTSNNATTYGVVALFNTTLSNPDYNPAFATATELITKATPTVKVLNGATDVTGQQATFAYTATAHALTSSVTGVPFETALLTASVTYDSSSTAPIHVKVDTSNNATTYAVQATFNTASNTDYNTTTANATELITKATPTVTILNGTTDVTGKQATFPYDTTAHALTARVTGVPFETAFLTAGITYDTITTAPIHVKVDTSNNATTYAVQATFNTASNTDYNTTTANATELITKATPTVTILNGTTDVTGTQVMFPYDTTAHALTTRVAGVAGETATLTAAITYDNNSTAPTHVKVDTSNNATTYAVQATFNTSSNTDYNTTSANATELITKATPTVKVLNGATDVTGQQATFAYTATAHALTSSVTGVTGETATLTAGITYDTITTAPTHVKVNTSNNATTYAVQATFNTSSNTDYNTTSANATELITKATPTVQILQGNTNVSGQTATFPYTATAHALTSTVTGVTGETATLSAAITYDAVTTAPTNVKVDTSNNATTYAVAATFNTSSDTDYNTTTVTAAELITKALPGVTVNDPKPTYDANSHIAALKAVGVDGVTSVSGSFNTTYDAVSFGGGASGPTNVKIVSSAPAAYFVSTAFTSGDSNYTNATANGGLTIEPATPTVTVAADPQPTFDGNAHVTTATVTGVGGVTVSGNFSFTYDGGAAPTNVKPGGSYSVVATFTSSDTNYTTASNTGSLTIKPATPTVTVTDPQPIYNAAAQNATGVAKGVGGATVNGTFSFTYDGGAAPINVKTTNGGAYLAAATFTSGDTNYNNSSGSGTLTIKPATPTVTVTDPQPTYSATTQNAMAVAKGVAGVTVSGTFSLTYDGGAAPVNVKTTNGGAYLVAATFTSGDTNYNNSSGNGTLTVKAATPTITVVDPQPLYTATPQSATASAKGVGGVTVNGTFSFTYDGGGPPVSVKTTNGGVYVVSATFASGDTNYANTSGNGTLTINKAHLTVTAVDQTRQYGAANPNNAFTLAGFQNGETSITANVAGSPTLSTGANATSTVAGSPYTISVVDAGTLTAPNYDFVAAKFVNGKLTITPAHLTVTGDPQTRVYGGTDPNFTATVSGFVNGENLGTSGVTGQASCTTTAVVSSNVAGYPITCTQGTLTASNYDFPGGNFVTGNFSITLAPLTVTANGKSRLYGDPNPVLDGSLIGVTAGDNITDSFATTAVATTGIGSVQITAALIDPGARLGNYSVTNNPGTLTISKAHLTVTATPQTRSYGAVNPNNGFALSGFKNSETPITANVAGSPTLSDAAQPTTPVGTFPITVVDAGTLTAPNYDFLAANFVTSQLTITPAHLMVTGDPQTRVYGGTNPNLTATVSGFVNGENLGTSGVTGQASCTTTAVVASNVAGYPITCTQGTLVASNYDFPAGNFATGNLAVTQAPLTVTANNKSRIYGTPNPTPDGSLVGVTAGDNITASFSTTAVSTTNVGPIAITASLNDPANRLGNYSVTNNAGTLTINQAHLTVIANAAAKTYDSTVFTAFTAALSGFANGETEASLRNSGALSGLAAFVGGATNAVNVGTYTVTPTLGSLSATNYDFPNFTSNQLAISASTVTTSVTAPVAASSTQNAAQFMFSASAAPQVSGTPLTGSSVEFLDNGNPITGSASSSTVPVSGTLAVLVVTPSQLAAGAHNITAKFIEGDSLGNFAAGAQTVANLTIGAAVSAVPGVALQPISLTIVGSGSVQYATLQCAVFNPAGQTIANEPVCTLSPSNNFKPTPSGTPLSVQLATTNGNSAITMISAPPDIMRLRTLASVWMAMPAIFVLPFAVPATARKRRLYRRVLVLLGLALLLGLVMVSVGCGGNGFTNPSGLQPGTVGTNATPVGNYVVQVSGTDSAGNSVSLASIPMQVVTGH